MVRKAEKILLYLAAGWNIINSILTIFGYSSWFQSESNDLLESGNNLTYLNASLVDTISKVVMLYGLLTLIIGIITFIIAKTMKPQPNKKIILWILACLLFSFISYDVIAIVFYLSTITIYIARNRALKKKGVEYYGL
ncbi:DUF4064 domain-containing protein [Streptococcus moroccensis]|uniref:DUF4064 domain-containing protein n=1 Tax=Streptococcus moroccensis TaxID=1451356 RepID=A0ABT9YSS2_9STRE|nr:DUF4064 domain-containing protein [Streptococcus moroccensis]MDQ0223051.1 hypothetical protein [Streptococcus moroccensis]